MNNFDVVIIGAGAAGLMCAIEAGKRGRRVVVLDHANKVGKKILMSGGGRCNFTNLDASPDNYVSHNPHFCKSALASYTQWDFIGLVQKHGIAYHEKHKGQLFCDQKAKDIVNLLLAECEQANVSIRLNCSVEQVKHEDSYLLSTSQGEFSCQSLVIASGGLSIPTMGASPFGYKIAEQFGLPVWPTRAGLVPFTLHVKDKEKFAGLSGLALPCVVNNETINFDEDLLFTHRGLSGPAMLQISSYWQPGETLKINLAPGLNLLERLQQNKKERPNALVKTILQHHFPKRVVETFTDESIRQKTLHECSQSLLQTISEAYTHWQVQPNGTEGYRTAEVTLGGVDCDVLSSKTCEAKTQPGLFFIGEVVDVTGWLGGYNFQWAWSSGFVAGQVV